MAVSLTRRDMLAKGALAAGITATASCGGTEPRSSDVSRQEETPGWIAPWSPPAGLRKNLSPGIMPIRLASWSRETTLDWKRGQGAGITERVRKVRDAGYTATNASYRASDWKDATEAEIRELHAALKDYDVALFDMHTTGSNIHSDFAVRDNVYRTTVAACEVAERIGCPMVTTHIGAAGGARPMSAHPDNWTMETWRKGVEVMKRLLADTAGMNVALGVEAVNMTIMNNPRAHLHLIEEVDDPRLKVCLDPVNMVYIGNHFRTMELIEECFDLLGDHIIAAHAKDTLILDKMSIYIVEVAPGKGRLDYETYLACLSRLPRTVSLLIEHIPDEEYPGAKAFIEDTAARLGVTIYS